MKRTSTIFVFCCLLALAASLARAGELVNAVFRVYRYGPDYPGLAGRALTPGISVEWYAGASPKPTFLPMVSEVPMGAAVTQRPSDAASDRPAGAWQVAVASLTGLIRSIKPVSEATE